MRPSPGWLHSLTPTAKLPKTERDPISTSGFHISLCRRTRRFLRTNQSVLPPPALAQPLTILSWPETLKRQWLQACLPDGHQPRCLSFPCSSRGSGTAARANRSIRISSCSSLGRSWPRPSRRPRRRNRSRPDGSSNQAEARLLRPQAAAGEPAPPAGRPRRPARTSLCPDCGGDRARIGEEVREQPRGRAGLADRAPAHPAQVRLRGLSGQRFESHVSVLADIRGGDAVADERPSGLHDALSVHR